MARNRWGSQPPPRGRLRFDLERATPGRRGGKRQVHLDELPPVVMPGGRILEAPRPGVNGTQLGWERGHQQSSACPDCGRAPGVNGDGTFRAHRPEADVFAGPHCPGGRPKGRQ